LLDGYRCLAIGSFGGSNFKNAFAKAFFKIAPSKETFQWDLRNKRGKKN